jgi:hypothetical protein
MSSNPHSESYKLTNLQEFKKKILIKTVGMKSLKFVVLETIFFRTTAIISQDLQIEINRVEVLDFLMGYVSYLRKRKIAVSSSYKLTRKIVIRYVSVVFLSSIYM